MPIEFIQEPQPTGVSGDTLFRLTMAYDGSGWRISKIAMRKIGGGDWDTTFVTHYTGIGTEVRENNRGGMNNGTKVVVNMPQGFGRYGIERADFVDSVNAGFGPLVPYDNVQWFCPPQFF